ncbi:VWA domain-containing protein [Rhizobium sp. EC-SD404]|uniref:vWA domain-containing protein n=1 Tax=Rhizobium sp. EC-SD404 TaxID=2038389 RepID=UPI001257801A|nr:VWA domain-containing protein [Rhizobium sp. EC-SD404]VVT02941.1 Ca-activated chloride channel family protein [Rhizobium sp. EC-SD404]
MRQILIAASALSILLAGNIVHSAIAQEGEASSLLQEFLSESGEDLEGCFDELVEMQSGPAGPELDKNQPPVPTRLLIALDASGSMAGTVGSVSKMEAAISAVQSFIGTLPESIDVGLVAFGHQGNNEESGKALSCEGVELLAAVGSDRSALRSQIDELSATGWTPLAGALEMAGSQLEASDVPGEQVVYVVSDGEETCGGDPIAAARQLNESDVRAIVNIIGLDLPQADREMLEAVANAGGGTFETVADGNELLAALEVRAGNIGEMTRVRAMSGHATSANNSAVGGAMLRVNTCVAGIMTRENQRFGTWRQSRRDANTEPDILSEVNDLHRARHDEARDRARTLYDALRAENDAANQTIRQNLDAAEDANDTLEQAQ